MKIAFFDAHSFEKKYFTRANKNFNYDIQFFQTRLDSDNAKLASGCQCICAFVNDNLSKETLRALCDQGVTLIALRSAGFNHVNLEEAQKLGLKVVRVPSYSPYAIAEHSISLMLTLNRKTHRAYNRVREGNFSLDGLVGFDLHQKTVGVLGTGEIGTVMCKILSGFGCKVLAYDLIQSEAVIATGANYCALPDLFQQSDVISLHLPLTPETHHLVNDSTLAQTKKNVMLINTGRGALIDTQALIKHLKSGHIGYAGLDVYEEEEGVFFENLSSQILQDDQLARLMTFPNVLITSHQGFLTSEALTNIAETTLSNIQEFVDNKDLANEVKFEEK